jgi:hypothetical protein
MELSQPVTFLGLGVGSIVLALLRSEHWHPVELHSGEAISVGIGVLAVVIEVAVLVNAFLRLSTLSTQSIKRAHIRTRGVRALDSDSVADLGRSPGGE